MSKTGITNFSGSEKNTLACEKNSTGLPVEPSADFLCAKRSFLTCHKT